MIFTVDGTAYRVGALALRRSWETDEVYRVTTEDGRRHRALRGVYPVYTLTLGNVDAAVYDALLEHLTQPAGSFTVCVPKGREENLTFEAMCTGLSDELMTERNGIRHWDRLTVVFSAAEPKGGSV